jgi:hypothetical protein
LPSPVSRVVNFLEITAAGLPACCNTSTSTSTSTTGRLAIRYTHAMDDLANLEFLSLVSKVTSEIQNHVGVSDKTLAEFVIDQHASCAGVTDFKDQLEAMGAEFPQSLVESIDRLVLTLHPKYRKSAKQRPKMV